MGSAVQATLMVVHHKLCKTHPRLLKALLFRQTTCQLAQIAAGFPYRLLLAFPTGCCLLPLQIAACFPNRMPLAFVTD